MLLTRWFPARGEQSRSARTNTNDGAGIRIGPDHSPRGPPLPTRPCRDRQSTTRAFAPQSRTSLRWRFRHGARTRAKMASPARRVSIRDLRTAQGRRVRLDRICPRTGVELRATGREAAQSSVEMLPSRQGRLTGIAVNREPHPPPSDRLGRLRIFALVAFAFPQALGIKDERQVDRVKDAKVDGGGAFDRADGRPDAVQPDSSRFRSCGRRRGGSRGGLARQRRRRR